MKVPKWVAATATGAGLLACGGGGGEDNWPAPGSETPAAIAISVPGRYIVKLAANGSACWVAMAEKALPFENTTTPDRQLLLSVQGGRAQRPAYTPPEGWSLIDFTVHPSREISIVLA